LSLGDIAGYIAGTPLWVWPLFVLLVLLGVRSLRERRVSMYALAVVPAVMMVVTLSGLFTGAHPLERFAVWLLSLAVMARIMWRWLPLHGVVASAKGARLPPSALPLSALMVAFLDRYIFGVLDVVRPDLSAQPLYYLTATAIAAAATGATLGRRLRIIALIRAQQRQARDTASPG
jgi:hypothetical protein